jgi:hypothetical protein
MTVLGILLIILLVDNVISFLLGIAAPLTAWPLGGQPFAGRGSRAGSDRTIRVPGQMAVSAVPQAAKRRLKGALHFIRCAGDSLLHVRRLMGYRHRLAASEASLQHAPLVVVTGFLRAVHVAEVDLYPGDLVAESVQCLSHHALDAPRQVVGAVNIPVSIDLYLHRGYSSEFIRKPKTLL